MRLLKWVLSVVGSVAFIAAPMAVQPAHAAQPAATAPIVQFAQSTTENVVEAEGYSVTTRATLRLGSSGSDVKFLQQQLKERGYYKMAIDGLFGSGTGGSVKAYQGASGLKPDGIVGPATWASLGSTSPPPSVTPPPSTPTSTNLKYGARGEEVKELQRLLKKNGFDPVYTDGIFGPGTANTVLAYQRAHGLYDDAVVGPTTWKYLRMEVQPAIRKGVPRYILNRPGLHLYADQRQGKIYVIRNHRVEAEYPATFGGMAQVLIPGRSDTGQMKVHGTPQMDTWVREKMWDPPSNTYGEGAMPRSQRLDEHDNVRIHGSNAIGVTHGSRGCVRVPKWAAEDLYKITQAGSKGQGTPVYIDK